MTNIDLAELDKLTDKEKELALLILEEYSNKGNSLKYNKLIYEDYEEIPVDIETFLHDRQYLGNALYNNEGKFTLFPYWEKKLKEIFPDNISTRYNTIIFTGAIGLGKSTAAVICLLYLLYRLLCLRDPYLHYGLQPVDKITISLMNITLDNARGVALDKMNQMLLSSKWFMNHGTLSGSTNLKYTPNKHIELITASSNNQVIGRAIYCNFTDECVDENTEVITKDGVKKIKDIIGQTTQFLTFDGNQYVLSDNCKVKPTTKTNEEYEIELEDGTILKCTGNHKLMLKDGTYKEAQYLTYDDELYEI